MKNRVFVSVFVSCGSDAPNLIQNCYVPRSSMDLFIDSFHHGSLVSSLEIRNIVHKEFYLYDLVTCSDILDYRIRFVFDK